MPNHLHGIVAITGVKIEDKGTQNNKGANLTSLRANVVNGS